MPTKITETNKKKVTSYHIIKPRNLLEASVILKYIIIIQITNKLFIQCTQQKLSTVYGVT